MSREERVRAPSNVAHGGNDRLRVAHVARANSERFAPTRVAQLYAHVYEDVRAQPNPRLGGGKPLLRSAAWARRLFGLGRHMPS